MDQFSKIYNIKNLNNSRNYFRFLCWTNIEKIENINLPDVIPNLDYEVVLIEFRNFPHIELLLRNAMLKINKKSKWSFSIVCGNKNFELMKLIKDRINKNITIYKLNIDDFSQSKYSFLLTTSSFWNLFNGEKLLIMQEDSFIFRDNIDDFLSFDYIGAPWPKHQNDTNNNIGNGGFSLRSKSIMLKIIETVDVLNTQFNSSTKKYMKCSKMEFPPEDVYFAKNMEKYKIGKISNYETGGKFSSESTYNKLSFGGHNFWIGNKNWKIVLIKNIQKILEENGVDVS